MSGLHDIRRWFSLKALAVSLAVVVAAELAVPWWAAASYDNVIRLEEGGYGYVPHLRGAYRSIESGNLLPLATDRHGSRDVPQDWRRGAEGLDIVVVGNSFVDATAVPVERRFTALLANRLGARVYNLGVQGQSLVNHLDRALYADERLDPEVVVLPLTTGADFMDTAQVTFRGDTRLSWTAMGDDVVREIVTLEPTVVMLRWVRAELRRLWLVRAGHQLFLQLSHWASGGGAGEAAGNTCGLALAADDDPVADQAYRLNAALIGDLHAALGDRLVLLMLPSQLQVTRPDTGCDWDRPERWAAAVAAREGLRLASPLSALRAETAPTFYDHGHLNRRGHAIVAETLARTLGRSGARVPVSRNGGG